MKFLQFLNMKKPSKEPPQKKAKTEEPAMASCALMILGFKPGWGRHVPPLPMSHA